MQLGMESDIGNQQFVGAKNPDSVLFVKFFDTPMDNAFESTKQGRPIKEMRTMVHIETPGNQLSIIETFAQDHHKARFPLEWARYQNGKTDGGGAITGTLLSDWQALSAATAEELKHFKFYTVEQVAAASDQQITAIGMMGGMDPYALREKAKVFLRLAADLGLAQKQQADLDAAKKREDAMREDIAKMQAQIESLTVNASTAEPKGKRASPEKGI